MVYFVQGATILRSRVWFSMPPIVVEVLNRFNILISQIFPRGLKHLIGMLVLSYERGVYNTATDSSYVFKP